MKHGNVLFFLFLFFLSACTSTSQHVSIDTEAPQGAGSVIIRNELKIVSASEESWLSAIEPAAGFTDQIDDKAAASYKGNGTSHCRLKDRFDRKELIAYNFDDGQSRLGLKTKVKGFSWSDAGNFDVKAVKLTFRYRLQKYTKPKERCLYESRWQGLVGSGYNEFHLREGETVYQELKQELEEFDDKLGGFF